jgi:spore maturation protein CgeB
LKDYEQAGAKPYYCQEAANPAVYRPYDLPREFDVTFVGQKYGNRPLCLRRLIDAGIDARVWGPNWTAAPAPVPWWRKTAGNMKRTLLGLKKQEVPELPREKCGPPLTDEELIRMYSRSRISLGFTSVAEQLPGSSGPIKQVRLRDFEATMSGAFYLVEYFEDLAEFFEPDKEIVFFRNEEELVDQCRYYLRHPEESERIRSAALRRARAEHTWQHRFEAVFRKLGLER